MSWAAGREFCGIAPVRPLKIGIVQTEDDRVKLYRYASDFHKGFVDREGWSEEEFRRAADGLTFLRRGDAKGEFNGVVGQMFVDELRARQQMWHFDLIVINPLFAFFGEDLSVNRDVTKFFREWLDPFMKDAALACGVLIVNHFLKPKVDNGRRFDIHAQYLGAGATDLAGWARAHLVLLPTERDDIFFLQAAKRKYELGWRDKTGARTSRRFIAYSDDLIFWRTPSADEIPDDIAKSGGGTATGGGDESQESIERKIVAFICSRNQERGVGKTEIHKWCCANFVGMKSAGGSVCKTAYDAVTNNPAKHGLEFFKDGKTLFYRQSLLPPNAAPPAAAPRVGDYAADVPPCTSRAASPPSTPEARDPQDIIDEEESQDSGDWTPQGNAEATNDGDDERRRF